MASCGCETALLAWRRLIVGSAGPEVLPAGGRRGAAPLQYGEVRRVAVSGCDLKEQEVEATLWEHEEACCNWKTTIAQ